MAFNEAAMRYAKALFQISKAHGTHEQVLNELRELGTAITGDKDLRNFFESPQTQTAEHKKVLAGLFKEKKFTDEVTAILGVLADKRRLKLLVDIVSAYQKVVDESAGIARGFARSAAPLFPEDRKAVETTVSKHTGKRVVLDYIEDKSLLGGLVAQVGSFAFDDSIKTQLAMLSSILSGDKSQRRMN